jgi:hypothetical protein
MAKPPKNNGKNQLSSLIQNARSNKDALEEQIAQAKRNKVRSSSRIRLAPSAFASRRDGMLTFSLCISFSELLVRRMVSETADACSKLECVGLCILMTISSTVPKLDPIAEREERRQRCGRRHSFRSNAKQQGFLFLLHSKFFQQKKYRHNYVPVAMNNLSPYH